MLGRAIGPASGALLTGHLFHDDAQKIAAMLALRNHFFPDLIAIETGYPEQLAVQPGIHQLLLVS